MTRVLGKWVAVALLAVAALWSVQPQAGVATTKHNLSVNGPGTVKATSVAETQTCVFCHVPHNSSTLAPLWNRNNPAASPAYTQYTSSTTKGTMSQPNGSSLLCLSCHDGTVALGELLSRGATRVTIANTSASGMLNAGTNLIGRDLSDDHPVSFAYNAALVTASAGELTLPAASSKVKLDSAGRMQCASCHDAHNNDITANGGKFLVMPNTASALCIVCHTKLGWSGSSHATSAATWSGTGTNPWLHTSGTTVAANACENCHQPHTALGKQRLLNYGATEEANCFTCHTGNVAGKAAPAKNMQTETLKISAHAVASFTGLHDPVEADVVLSATRHVECADCHNPHQTNTSAGTATAVTGMPTLPGSLNGVSGVDILGTAKSAATYEYEVCFRCHGDSTGKQASTITRTITTQANNVRLEFQTTNSSFHPVAGVGKTAQANMPSLAGITLPGNAGPLTASSTITCTSCHSNNAGPQAAPTVGTGPNGPHGSTISPLLTAQYLTADNTTESAANYALCYKCHNRTNILSTQATSFGRYHNLHLGFGSPCSACHDPHGVSTNPKLINFDTSIVTGPRTFTKNAGNGGSCNLTCHGKNHNPFTY